MKRTAAIKRVGVAAVVGLAALAGPATTAAQGRTPDFLFGAPRGAVSIRGGYRLISQSTSDNDVFDFFNQELTLQKSDFNGGVFGLDVAFPVHSRIDVLAGFEYSSPQPSSEYRDFVEDDGAPITQETKLTTVPVTGSVKLYLTPRGRSVSRFAFVPSKARPYVGVGGGFVWIGLEQTGDFVDFIDLSIFTSVFTASGWSTEGHAFAGLDLQVARRAYMSFEARYVWADAELSGDFVGFDPVDASGLQITVGIGVTF